MKIAHKFTHYEFLMHSLQLIFINLGFNSVKTPKNEHLNAFGNDLYDIVRNLEFKNIKSSFQHQLRTDVKRIKQDLKLLIATGKTNNLYRLTSDEYNTLLTENISKSYKKLINLH